MRKSLVIVAVAVVLIGLSVRAIWADSAEEWNSKGKEAYAANNYQEAAKYYSKALEINPKMQKTLFNRGLTYYRMKKYGEARTDLLAATAINPKDHEAIFYIGLTYFGEGKYGEAFSHFEKAAGIERLPLYLLNAAAARFNSGLHHATIQHCKMCLRLNPDDEIREKATDLMAKAEEQLKEDKDRLAAAKRSSVRMEAPPKKNVQLKWIQTADTSPKSSGGGGGGGGG